MIFPASDSVTAPLFRAYVPWKETIPRAPLKRPVPWETFAVPEKETTVGFAPEARARARRAERRIEPDVPLSTAVPLKTTHVVLVKVPRAAPVSVPRPIGVPRPTRLAPPEAVVPLTAPEPLPV